MSTKTIHPQGTLVRVTGQSVSRDPDTNDSAAKVGDELLVYGYHAADEGSGETYYLLEEDPGLGDTVWAFPQHVKVVTTAAERAARRPPSLKDLTAAISTGLHLGSGDVVEVDETDHSEPGVILAAGRAANGLRVAFRVRVDQIEETDL